MKNGLIELKDLPGTVKDGDKYRLPGGAEAVPVPAGPAPAFMASCGVCKDPGGEVCAFADICPAGEKIFEGFGLEQPDCFPDPVAGRPARVYRIVTPD